MGDDRGWCRPSRREEVAIRSNPKKSLALAATLCAALMLAAGPAGAAAPDFTEARSYGVGSDPASVAADFDRDGDADLAVVSSWDGTISILKNVGNGHFGERDEIPLETSPEFVTTADVDGDGGPDLVTANPSTNDVTVLPGEGAGTFGKPRRYPAGRYPQSVAARDLDGDGDRDLAATNNRDEAPGRVSVLKNRGGGVFGRPTAYDAGATAPGSVAAADFDGDRGTDLAINNFTNARVSVLTNRGNGAFGKATGYRTGQYPTDVLAANLGGSGRPDLAVVNPGPDTVSVLINTTGDRSQGP